MHARRTGGIRPSAARKMIIKTGYECVCVCMCMCARVLAPATVPSMAVSIYFDSAYTCFHLIVRIT